MAKSWSSDYHKVVLSHFKDAMPIKRMQFVVQHNVSSSSLSTKIKHMPQAFRNVGFNEDFTRVMKAACHEK